MFKNWATGWQGRQGWLVWQRQGPDFRKKTFLKVKHLKNFSKVNISPNQSVTFNRPSPRADWICFSQALVHSVVKKIQQNFDNKNGIFLLERDILLRSIFTKTSVSGRDNDFCQSSQFLLLSPIMCGIVLYRHCNIIVPSYQSYVKLYCTIILVQHNDSHYFRDNSSAGPRT